MKYVLIQQLMKTRIPGTTVLTTMYDTSSTNKTNSPKDSHVHVHFRHITTEQSVFSRSLHLEENFSFSSYYFHNMVYFNLCKILDITTWNNYFWRYVTEYVVNISIIKFYCLSLPPTKWVSFISFILFYYSYILLNTWTFTFLYEKN